MHCIFIVFVYPVITSQLNFLACALYSLPTKPPGKLLCPVREHPIPQIASNLWPHTQAVLQISPGFSPAERAVLMSCPLGAPRLAHIVSVSDRDLPQQDQMTNGKSKMNFPVKLQMGFQSKLISNLALRDGFPRHHH